MDVTLVLDHQLNASPNANSCVAKYPGFLIY